MYLADAGRALGSNAYCGNRDGAGAKRGCTFENGWDRPAKIPPCVLVVLASVRPKRQDLAGLAAEPALPVLWCGTTEKRSINFGNELRIERKNCPHPLR